MGGYVGGYNLSHVTAVDCPDLSDPANGEVTLSGNTFGSTATYRLEYPDVE